MDAAVEAEKKGISLEVIDLRTLVPPDMDIIKESLARTGRLVVAAEDRNFGGFVRQIQGDIVQQMPGIPTMAIGQKNVPGIAQSLVLEDGTILTKTDVLNAATEVLQVKISGETEVIFVPPRYFV